MADPYADLRNASTEMQTLIANALEARCNDQSQIEIRRRYLGQLKLPVGAKAVEFGSGTGHVTRDLIDVAGAKEALGIEPSEILVERARLRHGDKVGLTFEVGDASQTGLPDGSVDLVCMYTVLCHAPASAAIVAEAYRVLKPGGKAAVLDGDYDTTTVAIGPFDPLQPVVSRMVDANVHDRWLPRRLGPFLLSAGFRILSSASLGYVAERDPTYFLTVIDRGADTLVREKVIAAATSAALKAEARRRVADGSFYGFMSYLSVIAEKPTEA